ncbi:D-lactate dehydrogenase [Vibrio ishigakensis]|uniref:D-lactate dehydrogenase n=1 Tax=Vibrio ishigakensis TaxID=1481914 RepID=A0A0B8Q416_9VIBR|nr:D-lactate dehydrogenase [Vibrio ishigakensis]
MVSITFFSSKTYDQAAFEQAGSESSQDLQFHFYDFQLNEQTAKMAKGSETVCAFVNDDLSKPVLEALASYGVKLLVMRCAGFNNVDLEAAKELSIQVARVPAYSPEAIAEHAVADDDSEPTLPQGVSAYA